MTNSFYLIRHYLTIPRLFYVRLFPGPLFLFFGNCSGCHQGTKTRRIDMTFTSLSYNLKFHRFLTLSDLVVKFRDIFFHEAQEIGT